MLKTDLRNRSYQGAGHEKPEQEYSLDGRIERDHPSQRPIRDRLEAKPARLQKGQVVIR